MADTRFHYLHLAAARTCRAVLTVNGFPAIKGSLFKDTVVPSLINEFLVEGENELALVLEGADPPPDPQVVDEPASPSAMGRRESTGGGPDSVRFQADLRIFEEGQVVTPDDGEAVPFEQVAPEAEAEAGGAVTIIRPELELPDPEPEGDEKESAEPWKWKFTTTGYDFSSLLKGKAAPVEESALLEYAGTLLEFFKAGDLDKFLTEYDPRVEARAQALGCPPGKARDEARDLGQQAMSLGLAEPPEPDQLRTRPWCGGCIHELYIEREEGIDLPLIETNEDDEGAFKLPIYVALVGEDGALKIVR